MSNFFHFSTKKSPKCWFWYLLKYAKDSLVWVHFPKKLVCVKIFFVYYKDMQKISCLIASKPTFKIWISPSLLMSLSKSFCNFSVSIVYTKNALLPPHHSTNWTPLSSPRTDACPFLRSSFCALLSASFPLWHTSLACGRLLEQFGWHLDLAWIGPTNRWIKKEKKMTYRRSALSFLFAIFFETTSGLFDHIFNIVSFFLFLKNSQLLSYLTKILFFIQNSI